MSKPIIVAQNLVKRFENLVAVDQIKFEVQEGECFGFLGPNGAGKTSTMKMIYCFSSVSSGHLQVMGQDVQTQSSEIKRWMGVVPQEDNLDPDLGVLENLLIYARYFDIPKKDALERAISLLDFFQLTEKMKARIPQLSGGMKRRLVIARALINKPKILILDEPTTGLDPQARHLIWNKLRSLKKSGVTMALTTHYMEEATQLCDRLVIMNEGKILAQGSPADLIGHYVGREVYEIRASRSLIDPLRNVLKTRGFQAECVEETLFLFVRKELALTEDLFVQFRHLDFHHRMATLEDVFLKIAGRELRE